MLVKNSLGKVFISHVFAAGKQGLCFCFIFLHLNKQTKDHQEVSDPEEGVNSKLSIGNKSSVCKI